ncbi:MAG TPA: hypothetical protein VGN57_07450 [Pirellulaceae bacterium]|jgi:hypothetical protein|nr:hypothetical protein [Pirellulaceae bacterium]
MNSTLPTESDFVTYPETPDLDQVYAWRNFGGLTLDEAKTRFAENSLHYQEDFMYMGTNAFAFYFPVIDWWLRSVPERNEPFDDSEAWILAEGIQIQFRDDALDRLRPLIPAVMDLASYVTSHLSRFGDDEDQRRVQDAWTELENRLRTIAST